MLRLSPAKRPGVPRARAALALAALTLTAPAIALAQRPDPEHEVRLVAEIETSGDIRLGSLIDVTVRIRAMLPAPNTGVRLFLPPGVSLVAGAAEWSAALAAGQMTERHVTVRLDSTGIFGLSAVAADPAGLQGISDSAFAGRYLAVGHAGGISARDHDERFIPPALRALPALLGVREPRPDPAPLEPGQSVQGRQRGSRGGQALRRELAALRAQGVEALLADSAGQVGRIRQALAADRLESSTAAEPAAEPAAAAPPPRSTAEAAVLTCGQGEVARSGTVEYDDGSGGRVRLPLVRIRAASSYYGTPGVYRETRARADGTFTMCMPYSVEGYSFITAWQDNGAAFLFRDGASPPSAFANFFSAAWDLNRSSYIPVHVTHREAAFALHTFYRIVQAANGIFTARRGRVDVWYFGNADNNYYCPGYTAVGCSKPGEAIYIHRYRPGGGDYIFSGFGQGSHAHEYGHAYDRAVLGGIGDCGILYSHSYQDPGGINCAVLEGWGDFFEAITMPLARRDDEPTVWVRYGAGDAARGPEIEGAVATYLFDLIDHAGFPSRRTVVADDDPVAIPPDHLIQVLKNGNTDYYAPTVDHPPMVAVQEIIAVVDDVTPIPNKPEFAAYSQPTRITKRVARSSDLSVSEHRAIWLLDVFNKADAPPAPVVVTATVPGYVTKKATYAITGSATGGTGGYAGWRWDRCDDPGCGYTLWANAQSSQFVAYAGSYTIFWRLTARDGRNVSDTDEKQTVVCVASTSCGGGPQALMFAGAGDAVPDEPHFGSGPWLSADGDADSTAMTFFSLSGAHADWMPGDPVPNGLAAGSTGTLRRHRTAVQGRSVVLEESARGEGGGTVVLLEARGLTPGAAYRLSYAVDPDLGARPDDDRLDWVDSLGAAVVRDRDSIAIAYAWLDLPDGERPRLIEYGNASPVREPGSSAEAYADQRRERRLGGLPADVRFAFSGGALRAEADGRLTARFAAVRAATAAAALAGIEGLRRHYARAAAAATASAGGAPAEFRLRQSLGAAPALGTTRAGAPGSGAPDGLRARLRTAGITALDFAVAGAEPVEVRIRIYSNRGQLVRTLVRESKAPGEYHAEWDRLNERGERMPPGVYTAVMEAGSFRSARKLVVTR